MGRITTSLGMPTEVNVSMRVVLHVEFKGGAPRLGRRRRAALGALLPHMIQLLRDGCRVRVRRGKHSMPKFEGPLNGLGRSRRRRACRLRLAWTPRMRISVALFRTTRSAWQDVGQRTASLCRPRRPATECKPYGTAWLPACWNDEVLAGEVRSSQRLAAQPSPQQLAVRHGTDASLNDTPLTPAGRRA